MWILACCVAMWWHYDASACFGAPHGQASGRPGDSSSELNVRQNCSLPKLKCWMIGSYCRQWPGPTFSHTYRSAVLCPLAQRSKTVGVHSLDCNYWNESIVFNILVPTRSYPFDTTHWNMPAWHPSSLCHFTSSICHYVLCHYILFDFTAFAKSVADAQSWILATCHGRL